MAAVLALSGFGGLTELAKLLMFAGFLVTGIHAARRQTARAANIVIAYFLAVTTIVGLTQRESWPFTNWALMHHPAPREVSGLAIELVDERGRTYEPDARIWQPLAEEEIHSWIERRFSALEESERRAVSRFFLQRAEHLRKEIAAGGDGPNETILRAAAAPYHFQRKRTWVPGEESFPARFVALRFVWKKWNVAERAADERSVERSIVFEHRE
ncbi:MAG TPA: hypothetical protein VNL91_08960 [Thermoanaerobaculia bacterium]|nr:hypothetical protein [Thermoanaerobaculia bacterium]